MHPFLLICPFPTLLPASSVHSNGRGPAERTQKQRRERWSLHVHCRTFLSNAANGVPSGLSGEMDFSGLPRNSRIESLVIKRNRWHLGVKGGLFGIHTCCIHYRPSIWMGDDISPSARLRGICKPENPTQGAPARAECPTPAAKSAPSGAHTGKNAQVS